MNFSIPDKLRVQLEGEASRRSVTVQRLVHEILHHVSHDNLYEAVIDDESDLDDTSSPSIQWDCTKRASLQARQRHVLRKIDSSESGEITVADLEGRFHTWYYALNKLVLTGTLRKELRRTPGEQGPGRVYYRRASREQGATP